MIISMPTKIYFGASALSDSVKAVHDMISGPIMIVSGKSSAKKHGYLDKVIDGLKLSKMTDDIIHYEDISPNPKVNEINQAIKLGIKRSVCLVIGLGGGSAIDGAKAIAVGIGAKSSIDDYFHGNCVPDKRTLPIIAVPTTSGTGTELSKGAILSDPDSKIKKGIRGESIFPKIAIVCPEFTHSMPKGITREVGFDVFTHAVETFISKKSSPFTELLSMEAVKLVAEYLPRAIEDGSDYKAREQMSYASMIMGVNLGNASTCLPHRLQYPVGAIMDSSHGLGLAALYLSWIDFCYKHAPLKFNRIGSVLSSQECTTKEDVIRAIKAFLGQIGLSTSLRKLGLRARDIDELCSLVSGSIENDPASKEENIIWKIYEQSFKEL